MIFNTTLVGLSQAKFPFMANELQAALARIESAQTGRTLARSGGVHYSYEGAEEEALIKQIDAVTEAVKAILRHLT